MAEHTAEKGAPRPDRNKCAEGLAPIGNLCLDTGCHDADFCIVRGMTVARALGDVHRHFCADNAHDDACRVLRGAVAESGAGGRASRHASWGTDPSGYCGCEECNAPDAVLLRADTERGSET